MVLVVAFLVPLPVDDETIRAYQDQGGDAPPTSRSDSGGGGGPRLCSYRLSTWSGRSGQYRRYERG